MNKDSQITLSLALSLKTSSICQDIEELSRFDESFLSETFQSLFIIDNVINVALRLLSQKKVSRKLNIELDSQREALSKEIEANIQLKRLIARQEAGHQKTNRAPAPCFPAGKLVRKWLKTAPLKFSTHTLYEAFPNADRFEKGQLCSALFTQMQRLIQEGRFTKTLTILKHGCRLAIYENTKTQTETAPATTPNGEAPIDQVPNGDPQQPGVETTVAHSN